MKRLDSTLELISNTDVIGVGRFWILGAGQGLEYCGGGGGGGAGRG